MLAPIHQIINQTTWGRVAIIRGDSLWQQTTCFMSFVISLLCGISVFMKGERVVFVFLFGHMLQDENAHSDGWFVETCKAIIFSANDNDNVRYNEVNDSRTVSFNNCFYKYCLCIWQRINWYRLRYSWRK